MHVIATAGHVDHGKSTLVRALTGTDPDRLEEEHRRGLSIELGYCWTDLPPVGDVAFVDVPGHERFVSTMLSGIGPVPAVLFVVAADDPWMPQAVEHLAALDALGVRHGVVAVTRADLADPGPSVARAGAEVARTSLRGSPVVAVSGRTGQGLDDLRSHLVALVESLPEPDPAADVRLWVDRRFGVKGAGTVVTGTLSAGRVAAGDQLAHGNRLVRVRGVQALGRSVEQVTGVARVALNVTGDDLAGLERGGVLVTPDAWHQTRVLDVRLSAPHDVSPPERPLLHVGAASLSAHVRPLSDDLARLSLDQALPLRVGDRALLRDPGSRRVWGVTVLDPSPPPLRRRGAATARAEELTNIDPAGAAQLASELRRRGVVHVDAMRRIGVPVPTHATPTSDGWLLGDLYADRLRVDLESLVTERARSSPLDPGLLTTVAAERLGLPSPEVVEALVRPPMQVERGRITTGAAARLPDAVLRAVEEVLHDLEQEEFAAPTADRLRQVGLDDRAQAAAAKAGVLLRPAPGILLLPGADRRAVRLLAELRQPFTTSEARQRLGTSRRVVLPLLDHLDRAGLTRRLPDDRRTVVDEPGV